MSDTESRPALPGNEDKPAPPVVTPEEKPTGNGESHSVDGVVKPKKEDSKQAEKEESKLVEKEDSKHVKKEESKNGAEEEIKEAPMEVEQPAKEEVSTPVKATPTKKEEAHGDDAEEDKESSSDEEPPLGLLERPVEVSGKRERKKTERLSMSGTFTPTDKKLEVPEGSGMKLGDIPRVEHFISKTSSDDCKILHRTIYGRPGTVSMVKRNLRKFCGFTFSEDSPEFNKKKSNLAKLQVTELKRVAGILDQERTGSREEIAERCMQFLLNPKDSGKPIPQKKTRTKGGARKGRKRKRKSKKGEGEGDDEDDDDEDDDEDADNDDDVSGDSNKAESGEDEEEENSEGLSDGDDDSDVEKPKKKKPRLESPKKKKPTKTATAKPKKEKKEKKDKPKKEKKKPAPKKKKAASSGDESSDEDEPLSKKSKKGPPSNDEIRDLVKSILEGANLEEVTMKTVCKQVYLKFPDYDLTDRKDFIKSTVKQLIS
ncbi:protein DEK-like [Lineus longissimus]|uniref:protein DEK-like n=1 Tax=Lineus longissimus TaxID=88925 RepID=UPI002B4E8CCA